MTVKSGQITRFGQAQPSNKSFTSAPPLGRSPTMTPGRRAIIQIEENSLQGLFPECNNIFDRLVRTYGVKGNQEVKIWIACKKMIPIKNRIKDLPHSRYNFTTSFSDSLPTDFTKEDLAVITITDEATNFKQMVEAITILNPSNRIHVYVGKINEQIRITMKRMVGPGTFLQYQSKMEDAIEATCRYAMKMKLMNRRPTEKEKKKDETAYEAIMSALTESKEHQKKTPTTVKPKQVGINQSAQQNRQGPSKNQRKHRLSEEMEHLEIDGTINPFINASNTIMATEEVTEENSPCRMEDLF